MAQGSKQSLPIENINAMAELERLGWKFQPLPNNEVGLVCPVHDDTNPSVNLAVPKNLWKCQACNAQGDIVSLIGHILQKTTGQRIDRQTVIVDLSKRYDLEQINVISQAIVEQHHTHIWEAGPLLQALYDRGLTDQDIRVHKLGFHESRIMIPVYDGNHNVVNIRRYLPGAPGPEKMKNVKGYGVPPRLYPYDQLRFKRIVICGGEMKAIVAARLLNPEGIGALCLTASEGVWEPKWSSLFQGKEVYVCFDVDPKGLSGSRYVAGQLFYVAEKSYIAQLPLDPAKYPKGDINDFVAKEGATAAELLEMISKAVEFVPESQEDEDKKDQEIKDTKLGDTARPENVGRRLRMEGIINAMEDTPYLIPKTLGVGCDRNQPNCAWCPVRAMKEDAITGKVDMTIRGTARGILDMINSPEKNQREATREALRIPPCKTVTFTVKDHYTAYDVRLIPQLQIGGDNSDHVLMPAYIVGEDIDLNIPYLLEGKIHPHPKNQQAVLLIDRVSQAEDSLTSFAPCEDDLKTLSIFVPDSWTVEGIARKLDEYYGDIEANVTRIYHRRPLHLAIDLTYLSVLYFNFDGRLQNGWVNTLVAGDSAQGKSEASQRIRQHIGLGERVECKNASVAGLLGGLENLGQRFFVRWGAVPTHDKRALIMEEVNGMPVEVIGKMTDMRSSGVAELRKVGVTRQAHARTRQLWIANARNNRPLSQHNFGIEVISELIGSPQDIRRFDLAVLLSSAQIDPKVINRLATERPKVPHVYTPELCRRAVLWAWTRQPSHVVFTPEAEHACLEAASVLCSKFSEEMPLVDKGTMRYKIARLAIALAARTFSTGDTLETLLVRPCHIEYIRGFINDLYSDPVFGYEDFSRAQEYAQNVIDPTMVEQHIRESKYPKDFVEHLLHNTEITLVDIQDWCELDRDNAQKILSFLVRKHALYRDKKVYVKTSTFITLLKRMKAAGLPPNSDGNKGNAKF
jgi:hypothetical protein